MNFFENIYLTKHLITSLTDERGDTISNVTTLMSGVFTRYKGCIEVPQIEDVDILSAKFEVRDNADIGTPQHAQIMAKIESHYHLDSLFTHNTGLAA